jgi:hypothetical protein
MSIQTFSELAPDMGLTVDPNRGMFSYRDRYSEVVYRGLITFSHDEIPDIHPTDGFQSTLLGVFTRGIDDPVDKYIYCGHVSTQYKFIGNDVVNNAIRDSITKVGTPIISENTLFYNAYTRMRNEILIRNAHQVGQIGNIIPVMIVENSYNGTKKASVSFGLAIEGEKIRNRLIFKFRLGEMSQVHIRSSRTNVDSAIQSYMQVFSNDIVDMVRLSFEKRLTEESLFDILGFIEKVSKRKRDEISQLLSEIMPAQQEGQPPLLPSSWDMFLAIAMYSTMETNLNTKRILENAAESCLVIPERMAKVLTTLEATKSEE